MNLFQRGRLHALLFAIAMFSLTACGGGDSAGTPASTAPSSINVSAAYTSALRQSRTYSLTGKSSTGTAVTATLSIAPAATASYNGLAYDTTTLTSAVAVAGSATSTSVATMWLQQGSNVLMFETSAPDATCLYVSSQSLLPTTASLGQTGPYATASQYAGCTRPGTTNASDISIGTVTQTWSYVSIGSAGYVCMTSSDAGFVGTSTERDCFEVIDASGTLGTHAQVTILDLNGVTTTLATS